MTCNTAHNVNVQHTYLLEVLHTWVLSLYLSLAETHTCAHALHVELTRFSAALQHTALHCNTLQHTLHITAHTIFDDERP